ncbi:hypothetical protein FG91_04145 [Sphingopyxis sp. LC81]|uniref:hypothetical protein n=1 Tax=Sphingopyxis sp. LC81 TaxID=1502850 RepID=UPI00050E18B4|nr:hypothetical protein [Sphingopyxis sp. LC81]KGB51779.1 hypothetical protein FG91_04145 [Sphingopyxis sp. LC81]
MKLKRPLGMWERLAVVLTSLWIVGYSIFGYFAIAGVRDEQLKTAKLFCPSHEAVCMSEYMLSWTSWGDFMFALWAFGIAIGVALAFWSLVWAVYATAKWIWAGRKQGS